MQLDDAVFNHLVICRRWRGWGDRKEKECAPTTNGNARRRYALQFFNWYNNIPADTNTCLFNNCYTGDGNGGSKVTENENLEHPTLVHPDDAVQMVLDSLREESEGGVRKGPTHTTTGEEVCI